VGGYAVAFHGYARATADMDIWVRSERGNAERLVAALREFGFDLPELKPELFLQQGRIIRMGNPPIRIKLLTSASGVQFDDCYAARVLAGMDGVPVSIISLDDLKANKRAAGRHKDMDDLENLPSKRL